MIASYEVSWRTMGSRARRQIAEAVWRLMARVTLARLQLGEHFRMLRDEGLTPGHLKTLVFLDGDDARPMGAIAEGLAIDASQVTWLVDRLEERGFVERGALTGDRRVKTVALTPSGLAFRRKLLEHVYEPPPELVALDAATLAALRAQLEQLPVPESEFFQGLGQAR
jgi:DNA-binding MarR family transcriptional regulator